MVAGVGRGSGAAERVTAPAPKPVNTDEVQSARATLDEASSPGSVREKFAATRINAAMRRAEARWPRRAVLENMKEASEKTCRGRRPPHVASRVRRGPTVACQVPPPSGAPADHKTATNRKSGRCRPPRISDRRGAQKRRRRERDKKLSAAATWKRPETLDIRNFFSDVATPRSPPIHLVPDDASEGASTTATAIGEALRHLREAVESTHGRRRCRCKNYERGIAVRASVARRYTVARSFARCLE